MALTAIVGIGLNVLVGLTGQVSFGHVGFYAIGAYTVAILTTAARLPFTLALVLAALLSGLTGALLALPALRVRGPYLAMITIAFGFIVENITVEWRSLTGGQNGIMGIPSPVAFGEEFGERGVALLAIGMVALLLYAFWRLSASNWGKAMRGVKDSELAAESIGLNPVADENRRVRAVSVLRRYRRRIVRAFVRFRHAIYVRVFPIAAVRAGGGHRRRRHGHRSAGRRGGGGTAA